MSRPGDQGTGAVHALRLGDSSEPYLSYTIISGDTPTALKTDYFSEVIDGGNGGEIAIGTPQSPTRRFFKVIRAE